MTDVVDLVWDLKVRLWCIDFNDGEIARESTDNQRLQQLGTETRPKVQKPCTIQVVVIPEGLGRKTAYSANFGLLLGSSSEPEKARGTKLVVFCASLKSASTMKSTSFSSPV